MRLPGCLRPLLSSPALSASSRLLGFTMACCALLACDSLQGFSGSWRGPISPDPALRTGFMAADELTVTIRSLDGGQTDLSVQLPRDPQPIEFQVIRRASADALGALSLPGDSLRSYVGYLRPAGQEPYLMVLTLYPQERIEARIIRGPDEVYGTFRLKRL